MTPDELERQLDDLRKRVQQLENAQAMRERATPTLGHVRAGEALGVRVEKAAIKSGLELD